MALQNELLSATGKIGNLILYRRGNKYCARTMPAVVRQTAATKRAAMDFGAASSSGKLIRHALQAAMPIPHDGTLTNRLNKALCSIIRADKQHKPGNRVITEDNSCALKGFRFNRYAGLDSILTADMFTEKDTAGKISVSLHEPVINKKAFTAIEIQAAALTIDPVKGIYHHAVSETLVIARDQQVPSATLTVTPKGEGLVIVVLQLRAFQEKNGRKCYCEDRRSYATDVTGVFTVGRPSQQQQVRKRSIPAHKPTIQTQASVAHKGLMPATIPIHKRLIPTHKQQFNHRQAYTQPPGWPLNAVPWDRDR